MFKPLSAVGAAAVIAAALTMLTTPDGKVGAEAMAGIARAPMRACAERPWPYNRCAGSPDAARPIRLVTVDRTDP